MWRASWTNLHSNWNVRRAQDEDLETKIAVMVPRACWPSLRFNKNVNRAQDVALARFVGQFTL